MQQIPHSPLTSHHPDSQHNPHSTNYGRRRIRQVLIREEIWISECKIARILREMIAPTIQNP